MRRHRARGSELPQAGVFRPEIRTRLDWLRQREDCPHAQLSTDHGTFLLIYSVPPAGFEPAPPPPEGGALSPELRGPFRTSERVAEPPPTPRNGCPVPKRGITVAAPPGSSAWPSAW